MDDLDLPRRISVEVVYVDEHLLEFEAIVEAGHWRGQARAYTVPQDVAAFAAALDRFAAASDGTADFTAGADTGIGLIALRLYRIDRAGHMACQARLAPGGLPSGHRPEQVFQLAVEVRVEAEAVRRFSRQWAEMARTRSGRAWLAVEPDA